MECYRTFFNNEPDFIPHEGFAEWEIIPGCWLQLAEGIPAKGSGPLRVGVMNIEEELQRLSKELGLQDINVHSRKEVPVKWTTFEDPWGNRIGLFEHLNKERKK